MKKLNIKWMLSLIAAFTFASCDTDVDHDIPAVDAPVLVSTTPESGAAKVKTGEITIEVKYDKNIFFATDNLSEIKFTGGELISADVLGASNILTVKSECSRERDGLFSLYPRGNSNRTEPDACSGCIGSVLYCRFGQGTGCR